MSLRPARTCSGCALLLLGGAAALAQYSTPVGTGAAKPKTLRATAVLEWTGSLEKPSASRLMPIAVWDGERYQPAGLYLAHPAPLAFETGTQYQLERSGEPAGLFNVRAAGQVAGEWIGLGRFEPQAAPPPPPKLKPSKRLPVASGSRSSGSETTGGEDRPTLHTKTGDSEPASSDAKASTGNASAGSGSGTSPDSKPASSSSDGDAPTLHRRAPDPTETTSAPAPSATKTGAGAPAGTTQTGSNDSDPPTLHRRADSTDTGSPAGETSKAPTADTDRPTLHRPAETKASDADPDRPTLHRAHTESAAAASIDPDRPRLRYGRGEEGDNAALPVRLVGVPPSMQQMVAVSDAATGEERPYQYHWASPGDAAKMQAALAAVAAQAVARPAGAAARPAASKAQFGPASHTRRAPSASAVGGAPAPVLVEERFAAYELSFSGGATLVYTAHTAGEEARRVYVTLIAQPDFNGKPQVLFEQVTRGDRLDETPAMQLVDALDTDNDQRAELIFQLTGATVASAPAAADTPEAGTPAAQPADAGSSATAASSAASRSAAAAANASAAAGQSANAVPERAFAIYRVANGTATQVFSTGPLP